MKPPSRRQEFASVLMRGGRRRDLVGAQPTNDHGFCWDLEMISEIRVISGNKNKPAGLFTVPRKHIIFHFAMAKPSFWTWNWYHRFFRFFVFFCVIHNPYSVLWPTTMRTQTTSFSRATFFHSLASHSRARVCPVTLNRFSPVFSQRHCWDLIYFHSIGFLLLFVFEATEFGTPAFIGVQ